MRFSIRGGIGFGAAVAFLLLGFADRDGDELCAFRETDELHALRDAALHAAVSLGAIDMGANDLKPYFTIEMPPLMSVTTSLVLAFVIGLSLIAIKGDYFRGVMLELREVVFIVIRNVIIPLLPLFIFGIFLEMGAEGNVGPVMGMFLKIILIIFVMHVTVLVLQFCIAGAIAHKPPPDKKEMNMCSFDLTLLKCNLSHCSPKTH